MRVCLISPPTVTEFGERQVVETEAVRLITEHAPLGILSLAAALEAQGCAPHVVDLNRLYYDYVQRGAHDRTETSFFACVAAHLATLAFDVYGFSTICSSYPLTLRLAQAVRQAHPEATIMLGGPQASVVDVPTMKAFPFVDFVVRGEAEETLPRLLDAIASRTAANLAHVGGITYRRSGEVVRNPAAPLITDLDALPMPALHLYTRIADCQYVPLEAGRGCPFACSFCSTNDFFRRRFRMKSPHVLVAQMQRIKAAYGIASFDLIHDMFTVDRRKVLAFCEAIAAAGERFTWSCSARTDCVDVELLDRMARAGCRGVFFGIDTGSARVQAAIDKGLDLTAAAAHISHASRRGMRTTVSLIAGFPEETKDDLRATVRFYGESLRPKHTEVQFHLLAPLAETPITTRFKEQLIYDEIFSDISFDGWAQDPEDRALIIAHRDIFTSFYAVPTSSLDRRELKELREFLARGTLQHRALLLFLHQDGGDLLRVFDAWRSWLARTHGEVMAAPGLRHYYSSLDFSARLLEFVSTQYLRDMSRHPHLTATMAATEAALLDFAARPLAGSNVRRSHTARRSNTVGIDAVPVVADGVKIIEVAADYKRLLRCLKRQERLERIPAQPATLALMNKGRRVKVLRLNHATQQLLRACDGARNMLAIAENFAAAIKLDGVPAMQAGLYGLVSLHRQGLIAVRAAA